MANNVIKKHQTILNNNVGDQVLSHANQLTTKSWNDIINSLRTQANVNATYLSTLHKWLIGTGEGTVIIPDEKSFVEFVLECLTKQVTVEIVQADEISADSIHTKSGDNVFTMSGNVMQFGSEDATVKLSGAGRPLIQDTDNTYKKIATVDDLLNYLKVDVRSTTTDGTFIAQINNTQLQLNDTVVLDPIKGVLKLTGDQAGIVLNNANVMYISNNTLNLDKLPVDIKKALSINGKTVATLEDVAKISTIKLKPVTELPTTNIESNVIYLLKIDDDKDFNDFEEYLYVDGQWELIGTTKVDLSNYPTRDEVLAAHYTKDEIIAIVKELPTEDDLVLLPHIGESAPEKTNRAWIDTTMSDEIVMAQQEPCIICGEVLLDETHCNELLLSSTVASNQIFCSTCGEVLLNEHNCNETLLNE